MADFWTSFTQTPFVQDLSSGLQQFGETVSNVASDVWNSDIVKNLSGRAQGERFAQATGLDKIGQNVADWFDNALTGNRDRERMLEDDRRNRQYYLDDQERQRSWNLADAQWQAQREDSAVQRHAADLEAAGFNPALALGSSAGSGASVASVGGSYSGSSQGSSGQQGAGAIGSLFRITQSALNVALLSMI